MGDQIMKNYWDLLCSPMSQASSMPSLHKYISYLYAMVAKCIYNEHEGRFNTYNDALHSTEAKPLRRYLLYVTPQYLTLSSGATLINQLASVDVDMDGKQFLLEIAPDLLLPDCVDRVFSYVQELQKGQSFRNNLYKNFMILSVLLVKSDVSTFICSGSGYKEFIFDLFRNWEYHDQYCKIYGFDENSFFELYIRAFGIPLESVKMRISRSLSHPIANFLDAGESVDGILRIFYLSKIYKVLDLKQIDYPVSYLRSMFLDGEKVSLIGKSSPGEQFFLDDKLMLDALQKWRDADAINFIKALYFSKSTSEIALENHVTLTYLGDYLNSTENCLLLIEPNPDIVLRVLEDCRVSKERIVFAFFNENLTQIYADRFREASFASIIKGDGSNQYEFVLQKVDKQYRGAAKTFSQNVINNKSFFGVFIYYREMYESIISDFMDVFSTKSSFSENISFIDLLVPNTVLEKSESLRSVLRNKYSINWINLYPSLSASSGYKKRILMCLAPRPRDVSEVSLHRIWDEIADDSTTYYLFDNQKALVPAEELLNGNKTVNKLWNMFVPHSEPGKSRNTKYVDFSKEIRFWYSLSNGRGNAYYYACPTKKQMKNPLSRGKQLTKRAISAASIELAENKILEEFAFDKSWQEIICKDILHNYRSSPLSLKTYWFCKLSELEEKANYNHDVAKKLFESEDLSNLMSDQTYSLEEYKNLMSNTIHDDSSLGQRTALWVQLNIILNLAGKDGRFTPNPISGYVNAMREKDKGYRAARDSLAKKSYSLSEEHSMLDYLDQHVQNDGVYVGCAISFFTGMENREICALNWGDIHKTSDSEVTQLYVFKTLRNNGEITNFANDERNRYRRVPCVSTLVEILIERKEKIKKLLDENGMYHDIRMDDLPIVSDSEDHLAERCSPAALRKAKEMMEEAAGISVLSGSVIYDDDTEKNTDFNDYRSDRFRANLRYRLIQTCNMSLAELNYILGISMPSTFSKHYCDYTNDFAQLMLCKKMERWLAESPDSRLKAEQKELTKSGLIKLNDASKRTRSILRVDVNVEPESTADEHELKIEFKTTNGADVYLYKF